MIWYVVKGFLSIFSFALIAGISYLLVSWLWQRLSVRHEREHQINIHHKANFRASYYLAVEAPQQPALRFRFMAGNLPLAEISQPAAANARVVANSPVKVAAGKPAKTVSAAPATASSHPIQQQALEGTSKAVAKTGTFANLLGALAGLLPGSLGENARKAQEGVRQGQVKAAKAVQAPKQAQQRITVLQSESQKLGGANPAGARQAIPSAAKPTSSAVTSHTVDIQADETISPDTPANPIQHPFSGLYCVQTFELDPEQTLPLKLMISSATRQPPVGSFPYTLHLQVVPLENLQEKIPVLSRRGTVHYASVAAWRSFIPGFVGLLLFLICFFAWACLLVLIWQWK